MSGKRVVAAGDDDALGLGLVDERRECRLARVSHDLDAVRVGRHGLLELVDHRLLIPLGVLLDQLHVVRRRGRPGAVGARQRCPVTLRAAALHVDDQLLVRGPCLDREQRPDDHECKNKPLQIAHGNLPL